MSTSRPAPDAGTLEALRRPEERIEGRAKVTGAARYAADRLPAGALWARFMGSPLPHARIRSIDASRARAMPGVHAVLTGEDLRGIRFGRRLQDRPLLAWDRVLFVGDRLAAVAAETPEQAEAALAEIEVDLEELPPILDLRDAQDDDAPVLHPEAAEYRYLDGERPAVPHPNVQGRLTVDRGAEDLDAVFAGAAEIHEHRFSTPRQHAAYIEPHATAVWIDGDGVVHVITTNKAPYTLRKQMAAALDLPADRIIVDAEYIGGDFGGKGYSIDEYGCWALARATGRPVRSITRYADELGALNVRHASEIRLRTALDADGRLLAHEAVVILDGGAYASAKPLPHLALAGAIASLAAYRVPNARIDVRTVYTNTVPGGHMRTPGEVQALFAGESHLDGIARARGEDPLAFRLRNAVTTGDEGAGGQRFREARAVEVLEAVRDALPWDRPLPPDHGRGVALSARHVGGGKMPLALVLSADGRIEVLTGLADQGGGAWTVIERVLAASLSLDEARITVRHVPTSESPFDPGIGGSRVTHIASRSAELLADQLREWLDERLPAALPGARDGVVLRGERFVDRTTGTTLATFDEVVALVVRPDEPVRLSATYVTEAHGEDEGGDYDFGACAVVVHVDRATGEVRVIDALLVADVGTIINPVAHRGQLEGGFIFGLGGALMEELVMDGGAVTTLSLADMKIPSIGDVPPLRVVELPTTIGPGAFGAKMAGELTNAPVAPAIANAVADAIGVRIVDLPISAERVHRALRESGRH